LLSEANSAVRMKCANTRVYAWWRWANGRQRSASFVQLYRAAEERNDEYYIRLIAHNLGTPAGMRGDFGEALRWLSRMLRKGTAGTADVAGSCSPF